MIPSCPHIFPCLHMGAHAVPFPLQLPWQREMLLPGACSRQGQQDRPEPGETWDLICPSHKRLLPGLIQQWQKHCLVDVVSAGDSRAVGKGSAGSASSPRVTPKLQLCSGTFISERGTRRKSISDHKLQTPWLSWQLHHKICFFTFSQTPSWNFSDFSSLLFLLGPEPLRRTGIFSNLCPRCNQLIFFFPCVKRPK